MPALHLPDAVAQLARLAKHAGSPSALQSARAGDRAVLETRRFARRHSLRDEERPDSSWGLLSAFRRNAPAPAYSTSPSALDSWRDSNRGMDLRIRQPSSSPPKS